MHAAGGFGKHGRAFGRSGRLDRECPVPETKLLEFERVSWLSDKALFLKNHENGDPSQDSGMRFLPILAERRPIQPGRMPASRAANARFSHRRRPEIRIPLPGDDGVGLVRRLSSEMRLLRPFESLTPPAGLPRSGVFFFQPGRSNRRKSRLLMRINRIKSCACPRALHWIRCWRVWLVRSVHAPICCSI